MVFGGGECGVESSVRGCGDTFGGAIQFRACGDCNNPIGVKRRVGSTEPLLLSASNCNKMAASIESPFRRYLYINCN